MKGLISAVGPILLFLGLTMLLPVATLHAQEITVRGRVVGPDGAPLAEQRVVLHRVDAAGGATIAETASGADGGFEMRAVVPADTGAVYFVAARYDEELYIGPPFRPADGTAGDQVIQVGVPAMSASSLLAEDELPPMPARQRQQNRTWLLLLIPLVGILGVAAYALIPRKSIPEERALLIRIAELDERTTTAPEAHRAALLAERRQLIAQLRTE
jgi:hypothetical protein